MKAFLIIVSVLLTFTLAMGITFIYLNFSQSNKWQYAYTQGVATGIEIDHSFNTVATANKALFESRAKDSTEFFNHFASFK